MDEALEQRFAGVSRVKFYLPEDADGRAHWRASGPRGWRCTPASSTTTPTGVNSWRAYYRPMEIGEKLLVIPEWESADCGGRVPLRLDPGLIFGTGSHATTRMCLEALEKCAGPGRRVLDLGCGSGILGIGARVLGCGAVRGCDIDPKAPEVALRNAELNGIDDHDFKFTPGTSCGRLSPPHPGRDYDIVLANIVSDVIIPLAPLVPGLLAPEGTFITSGIIDGREGEVAAAVRSAGLEIEAHRCQEEWHCFVCRRNNTSPAIRERLQGKLLLTQLRVSDRSAAICRWWCRRRWTGTRR